MSTVKLLDCSTYLIALLEYLYQIAWSEHHCIKEARVVTYTYRFSSGHLANPKFILTQLNYGDKRPLEYLQV